MPTLERRHEDYRKPRLPPPPLRRELLLRPLLLLRELLLREELPQELLDERRELLELQLLRAEPELL